jgi:two-component system response regulator DesR
MTGLELAKILQARGYPCKLIILTTFARSGYLQRAMSAGVQGYLLKDAPSENLADAIRKVAQGGKCIDPELIMESWELSDPLTNKERIALRYALAGQSTADIAAAMCLSAGTIRNYLSEAMSKLHAKNRIEAARIAQQKGWL